ncbi:hypothetical protein IE077_000446 [Cardiosporidium cionae]|uniref:Uncharacterized protein n=1 Tax=Cardiosporidium cionae TaxID=476202 RepID=A0ABQ7J9B9_9APIC|nr:hypothetical protein IE077_000446 [Cardiosporidium cionae]|eukprot:KAF8820598.1 hypothetical protein IE077_000446 [Cardiosporidium cionae]
MAEKGERSMQRKATVEIQRRTGRTGTVPPSGRRQGENVQVSKQVAEPSEIPHVLTGVYTEEGFDPNSAILACNFPSKTTTNQCRNFFSWIGPVIRVDRGPSVVQESNFVVVFAFPEAAKDATSQSWNPASTVEGTGYSSAVAEAAEYLGTSAEHTAANLRASAANLRSTISENWDTSAARDIVNGAGSAVTDAWQKATDSIQQFAT